MQRPLGEELLEVARGIRRYPRGCMPPHIVSNPNRASPPKSRTLLRDRSISGLARPKKGVRKTRTIRYVVFLRCLRMRVVLMFS